jgi:DNA-binding Lrp family transcriptional regulator
MAETQRFNVKSSEIVDRVKQLIHEGNIRRVRLLHDEKTVIEIPLTVGAPVAVVGILAAPLLAAIGAFAALVTECTIEVEKVEEN